jgi:hypothetical protein
VSEAGWEAAEGECCRVKLNKRERKLLEYVVRCPGRAPVADGLPEGVGGATVMSLSHKGLVTLDWSEDIPRWYTIEPAPLGRFVGSPLEWREVGEGLAADFLGGFAIVYQLVGGRWDWFGRIRQRKAQLTGIKHETRDAARLACEAWADEERLRQAGEEKEANTGG